MPDAEALIGRLDEAAGPDHGALRELQDPHIQRVGGDLHDLIERHTAQPQSIGVDLHLRHLDALPPDRHVGDTRHAEQPCADRPIGNHRQVHQGDALRRHADLHHPTGGGDRRDDDRWSRPGRQRREYARETFLDQLPCPHDVRAGLEQQLDRREIRDRLGAHQVQPVQAVEGLLQRHGDEAFDLLGGEPEAGRLDFHPRRRELRERVDRRLGKLGDAEYHHRGGSGQHDEPEPQARANDRPHHHSSSNSSSLPYSSAAPTVTTVSPTFGPVDSTARSPVTDSTVTRARTNVRGSGFV